MHLIPQQKVTQDLWGSALKMCKPESAHTSFSKRCTAFSFRKKDYKFGNRAMYQAHKMPFKTAELKVTVKKSVAE